MSTTDLKTHYEAQGVYFPYGDEDYQTIQKEDITNQRSHFNALRLKATNDTQDKDYFGIIYGGKVWLLPIS